jgi:methylphosphotriester-DNA--protein-cysteine methyltransferase
MLVDLKLDREYDGLLYLAESARNLQRIESHHHAELELNLVVQGTITYVMNGCRFTFTPRTILWLFPEQEHQLVDRSDNARFYVVAFKPSLIDKSCHTAAYEGLKRAPDDGDHILSTVLDPKSFDLVCKVLDSLMQTSLDADLLNREAGFGPASNFRFAHRDPDSLNAGLHYLLLHCWSKQFRTQARRDAVALHPAVRRALKLLSEDVNEQDLAELAKACGTSKSYLSRTFHRQIGVPLNRYRNSLRLARFFEQYRQPDTLTLAEAVYAAGFGSYAQFYKVFVQAYGCGPRECLQARMRQPGDAQRRR